MCCISFQMQNGQLPLLLSQCRVWTCQSDWQIPAVPLRAQHPRLYSNYLHSLPHRNQTLHERKRKTAHFKAAGKPPLATCQASAKPSCLSEHAHLKPTARYYGNSVGSLEVRTAILISECKKPNAAGEVKGKNQCALFLTRESSPGIPEAHICVFKHKSSPQFQA